MPGMQYRVVAFDGSTKSQWLDADINGLLHTWMATIALAIVLWLVVFAASGIDLGAYTLGPTKHWLVARVGNDWSMLIFLLGSMAPAFVIVFVLRRNFIVIGGARRNFRYLWRWL